MRELTLFEALSEAYSEELERDQKTFLIGQNIRGDNLELVEKFGPDRIIDTPISECGMYGTAFGAALDNYRPIVDFGVGSFMYMAYADITIATGGQYFLYGSQTEMPITITALISNAMACANDYSMPIHGAFFRHPGLKVAMPSTPYDAKGMMKAAIRDNNPVIIPIHEGLLMDKGPVPKEDYIVPLGVAEVKRGGSDITLVANSYQLKNALAVADKLKHEFSVEVIDPRTFEPFDMPLLVKSLTKTGRLVIIDEDWERGGFASTLLSRVVENNFSILKAPIRRVTYPNIPIPGGYIGVGIRPNEAKIEAAIRDVISYQY